MVEMQEYYDERRELWQEGDRGLALLETIDKLQETIDLLTEIES